MQSYKVNPCARSLGRHVLDLSGAWPATSRERLVVPFNRAAGRFGSLPKNLGIRSLIGIQPHRLGVGRHENDVNAAIVSQAGRTGIVHPLFRRLVWILGVQVANLGLVQQSLLAVRGAVNLLRKVSL